MFRAKVKSTDLATKPRINHNFTQLGTEPHGSGFNKSGCVTTTTCSDALAQIFPPPPRQLIQSGGCRPLYISNPIHIRHGRAGK